MIELKTQICDDGKPPLTTISQWDETHEAYYHDALAAHALLQAVEEARTICGKKPRTPAARMESNAYTFLLERAAEIHAAMMKGEGM